jgi:hypothetical protein
VFNTEACSDTTGGKNICDFNQNAFIEFECNVKAAGTYTVSFRYAAAANKTGSMQFMVDGVTVAQTQPLPFSGGWQSWASTAPQTIKLSKGEQKFKILASGVNFNFNYVELVPVDVTPDFNLGDVDQNGTITAIDALTVLKAVVGKVTFDETEAVLADVDGDNKITSNDALQILKKVVGKLDKFPAEE